MFRNLLKAVALAVACAGSAPEDSQAQEFPALTTADLVKANLEFERQFLNYAWNESLQSSRRDPAFAHCYVNPFRINAPGVREEARRIGPYLKDDYIAFDPLHDEVKLFPVRQVADYYPPIPYRHDLWYGPSPTWIEPGYGLPNYPTPHYPTYYPGYYPTPQYPTYYPGYYPSNYPWYVYPSYESPGDNSY